MDEVVLENERGRAVILPRAGAGMRSLRVRASGGEWSELLTAVDGRPDPTVLPQGTGSFIMAPWPNRIRDGVLHANGAELQLPKNLDPHAIHGTVRDREWRVVASTTSSATLDASLTSPWPSRGTVTYEVSLDGPSLRQSLTVEAAEGEQPFPAGFGWHPWFRQDIGTGPPQVRVPGQKTAWELEEDFSATGRQLEPEQSVDLRSGLVAEPGEINQCMRIDPGSPAAIEWPDAIRLEIRSSPEVAHLIVYATEESVCVEPETCTINAFRLAAEGIGDTGTVEVRPGQPLSGWTRWSWE